MQSNRYIIRGGVEGRERLRLLALVLRPTTLALFDRAGVRAGMIGLDAGCGGGDVTLDLAELVGPAGRVVGFDIDSTKLDLARQDAADRQLGNVEFRQASALDGDLGAGYDFAYARFLLSHLADPAAALARIYSALRPGGILILEDIDFAGHFAHPDCPALRRYVDLYTRAVRHFGGDPTIGPRLPIMLAELGCERIAMNVVQPAALDGELKLINPITMENIAGALIAAGLATREETDRLASELTDFARDPRTVMSIARIVQAWGWRSPTRKLE